MVRAASLSIAAQCNSPNLVRSRLFLLIGKGSVRTSPSQADGLDRLNGRRNTPVIVGGDLPGRMLEARPRLWQRQYNRPRLQQIFWALSASTDTMDTEVRWLRSTGVQGWGSVLRLSPAPEPLGR